MEVFERERRAQAIKVFDDDAGSGFKVNLPYQSDQTSGGQYNDEYSGAPQNEQSSGNNNTEAGLNMNNQPAEEDTSDIVNGGLLAPNDADVDKESQLYEDGMDGLSDKSDEPDDDGPNTGSGE